MSIDYKNNLLCVIQNETNIATVTVHVITPYEFDPLAKDVSNRLTPTSCRGLN